MPAQRALPMRPLTMGPPRLPEHSSVKSTSRRGRACSSASVSDRGLATRPETPTCQLPASRPGWDAVVSDIVEFLGRGEPGVELFPDQLVAGNVGWGIPGPLVEPREDHVAGLSEPL